MIYKKCPKCIHAGNKCQHVIANTLETLFYLKNTIQYNCNIDIDFKCNDFKFNTKICENCKYYKFNNNWDTYFCCSSEKCINSEQYTK